MELALDGIMHCAKIAAYFNMGWVLDKITVDVCKCTSLLLYAQSSKPHVSLNKAENLNLIDPSYLQSNENVSDGDNLTEVEESIEGTSDEGSSSNGGATLETSKAEINGSNSISGNASASQKDTSLVRPVVSNHSNSKNKIGLLDSEENIKKTLDYFRATLKAQIATTAVFDIVRKYGNTLRLAWPHVIYCMIRLFDMQVLPTRLLLESEWPENDILRKELRIGYHKAVKSVWLESVADNLSAAKEGLVQAKGWMSWLSGESSQNAERKFEMARETLRCAKQAMNYSAISIGYISNSTPKVHFNYTPHVVDRVHVQHLGSLVSDSIKFDSETLVAFVCGILQVVGENSNTYEPQCNSQEYMSDVSKLDISVQMLSPVSYASRLFALTILVNIAVSNIHRLDCIWRMIRSHMIHILNSEKMATALVEKASVGLLRISLLRLKQPECCTLSEELSSILTLLWSFPEELAPGLHVLMYDAIYQAIERKDWSKEVIDAIMLVLPIKMVKKEADKSTSLVTEENQGSSINCGYDVEPYVDISKVDTQVV